MEWRTPSRWYIKPYLRQIKLGVHDLWAYKWYFFGDFVRFPVTIAMHLMIFYFIFSVNGIIEGYNRAEGLTYILVVSMISRSLSQRGIANMMETKIIRGDLVNDLSMPIHISLYTFTRRMGYPIYLAVISIITFILAGLIFPEFIILPSLLRGLITIIYALVAMGIQMQIYYIIGILAFWLKNIGFITRLASHLQEILGGRYFPLTWLPAGFLSFSIYLPFLQMYYLPATILLGKEPVAIYFLFLQLIGWLIGLQYILTKLEGRGLKNFDGSGG